MKQRRIGDIMQMLCNDTLYSRPEISAITGLSHNTIVWQFNRRKIPVNCEIWKGSGSHPAKMYLGSDIKAAFRSYQHKKDKAKEKRWQEKHGGMLKAQDLLPGVDYEGEASVRQNGTMVTINGRLGASSEVYKDEEEARIIANTYILLFELLDIKGKIAPDLM